MSKTATSSRLTGKQLTGLCRPVCVDPVVQNTDARVACLKSPWR